MERTSPLPQLRFSIFLLVLISIASLHAAGADPVVSVTGGKLSGHISANGRAEFLGIAYAQPPVGDLRWHEPVAPKPWDGVRDAKAFGSPCAQNVAGDWNKHDAEISKEDCLYLNVITPQWPPKKPLPVMFWIHGGANTGGTASAQLYKDGTLEDHGIILVTANYRLGVFGFLAHPELTRESAHHASGNYAILDQIAALEWVRDNIAKFGGDPHNITVFGQSAGAIDTGLLMTSPLSKNLFHKAIAESGTVLLGPPLPLSVAEQGGVNFAERLHAPAEGSLKYLRGLSTAELLKAALVSEQNQNQGPNAPPDYHPWPVVDGWVFPQSPDAVFASGQESAIPFIIGNNTREFDFPIPMDALQQWMKAAYGDLTPQGLRAYGLADGAQGSTDPLYGSVANQWAADFQFRCPATAISVWHTKAGHPVYEYQFEHAVPGQEANGAVHSAELPYVFGFYPKTGNIAGAFNATDFKIADTIETYWTNFAKTGNPNGAGVPNWPEVDKTHAYVALTQSGDVKAGTKLREAQCSIYRQAVDARVKK